MTCRAGAGDAAGGAVASASAAAAASPFAAPPPIARDWLGAGRLAGPGPKEMAMARLASGSMGRATASIGGMEGADAATGCDGSMMVGA